HLIGGEYKGFAVVTQRGNANCHFRSSGTSLWYSFGWLDYSLFIRLLSGSCLYRKEAKDVEPKAVGIERPGVDRSLWLLRSKQTVPLFLAGAIAESQACPVSRRRKSSQPTFDCPIRPRAHARLLGFE